MVKTAEMWNGEGLDFADDNSVTRARQLLITMVPTWTKKTPLKKCPPLMHKWLVALLGKS
jgi:hypothetical protein